MLTEIRLRNFKAFGENEQKLALSRLNVFIGENGTGKSSVLQALTLLAQSAGKPSAQPGKFKFSSFSDLVHGGTRRGNVALGFAGRTSSDDAERAVDFDYGVVFREDGSVAENDGRLHVKRWPDLEPELIIRGTYKYGDSVTTPTQLMPSGVRVELQTSDAICQPVRIASGGPTDSSVPSRKQYESLDRELRLLVNCFIHGVKNSFVVEALRGFADLSYVLADEPSE
mgnify:FL=1